MHRIVVLAALLSAVAPLGAQEVPPDTAGTHIVRPGDTLWDLARRYLQDPFRWPEIHRLNEDRVSDPHRIYPSERLRIPQLRVQGRPAERGGGFILVQTPEPPRTVFFGAPETRGPRSVIRQIQEAEVPVVLPGDFLRAGLLVPESEIAPLGVLVEAVAASVVPLEIPAQIALYDRVFMTVAAPGAVRIGDRLHLLRPGRRIRPHGRIFEATGIVRVLELDGPVATVEVEQLFSAVRLRDVAVPLPAFEVPIGVSPEPAVGLEGRIITFAEIHPLQLPQEIAYIDLGRGAGVSEGDEFEVVLPRTRTSWGTRPEIRVGRLQVVRTRDRSSAVRVVSLEQPALEPGLVVRRVARMP